MAKMESVFLVGTRQLLDIRILFCDCRTLVVVRKSKSQPLRSVIPVFGLIATTIDATTELGVRLQ